MTAKVTRVMRFLVSTFHPGGLPVYMKYRGIVVTARMPIVTPDIPVMRRTTWVFMCLLPFASASEPLMLWRPQQDAPLCRHVEWAGRPFAYLANTRPLNALLYLVCHSGLARLLAPEFLDEVRAGHHIILRSSGLMQAVPDQPIALAQPLLRRS